MPALAFVAGCLVIALVIAVKAVLMTYPVQAAFIAISALVVLLVHTIRSLIKDGDLTKPEWYRYLQLRCRMRREQRKFEREIDYLKRK